MPVFFPGFFGGGGGGPFFFPGLSFELNFLPMGAGGGNFFLLEEGDEDLANEFGDAGGGGDVVLPALFVPVPNGGGGRCEGGFVGGTSPRPPLAFSRASSAG